MSAFCLTLCLLVIHLFDIPNRTRRIPWLYAELVICTVYALLYLTAASLAVDYSNMDVFAVAAVSLPLLSFFK